MTPPAFSIIGGFFVRALLWLAPALTLWYLAREWVVVPVAWLSETVMRHTFPLWVTGSELEGNVQLLLTSIRVVQGGQVDELTPEVRILSYCYGLPLFVALLLAARARGLWWKLPLGAVVLLPFQTWGVCFGWLVDIAIHMRDLTLATTRFSDFETNLIGIGYQLGYLLLPVLAPLLLWLHLERRFITLIAVDGAMEQLRQR